MMRLPNGYGSVVKLSSKRRKPYAVRVSAGYKDIVVLPNKIPSYPYADKYHAKYVKSKNAYVVDATDRMIAELDKANINYHIEGKRIYKYLAYFEKSAEAYTYLAGMNSGQEVKEHVSIASEPSFKAVYEAYLAFMQSRRNKPSESTITSWTTGFNGWASIHDLRFRAVTTHQLQDCISEKSNLAQSSVGRMMTVLRYMYKYALAHGLCDEDRSKYVFVEYSKERKIIHKPFTDDEIKALWSDISEDAAMIALLLCYTGMRGTELLTLRKDKIFLDKQYAIGGIKTENGIDRVIPLHNDILPIINKLIARSDSKYLYSTESGTAYTLPYFCDKVWDPYMKKSGLNHYTHDGRHTCATKLEASGISKLHRQLILGHALSDVTDKVYTHVAPEVLVADMNSISWRASCSS